MALLPFSEEHGVFMDADVLEAYLYQFLGFVNVLGSLAQIYAEKASIAVAAFLSLPINRIQIDEWTLRDPSSIMLESGVSYDSIHAA